MSFFKVFILQYERVNDFNGNECADSIDRNFVSYFLCLFFQAKETGNSYGK